MDELTLDSYVDVILRLLGLAGIFVSFGEGVCSWGTCQSSTESLHKKKRAKPTKSLEVFDGHKLGLFLLNGPLKDGVCLVCNGKREGLEETKRENVQIQEKETESCGRLVGKERERLAGVCFQVGWESQLRERESKDGKNWKLAEGQKREGGKNKREDNERRKKG